jgi:8-oxo-dGTP diphosphatase
MKNAYEAGIQKIIPAVLVYIFKENKVLMLHRQGNKLDDVHLGFWNGLGGKCEGEESFLQCAKREIKEESSLDIDMNSIKPLGILQFPNFKPHKKEDWVVAVYRIELPTPFRDTFDPQKLPEEFRKEGELHWVDVDRILTLPLWEGDQKFLPLVLKQKKFFGCFWYEERKLKNFELSEM